MAFYDCVRTLLNGVCGCPYNDFVICKDSSDGDGLRIFVSH